MKYNIDNLIVNLKTMDAGVSDLAGRVSDLESTVGDDTEGLVKDVGDIEDLIPATASAENQLATMGDIAGVDPIELTPTENETYGGILSRLLNLIDATKFTPNSVIVTNNNGSLRYFFPQYLSSSNSYTFIQGPQFESTNAEFYYRIVLSSSCVYDNFNRSPSDGSLTKRDWTDNKCSWTSIKLKY